jgi:hypothetical protein
MSANASRGTSASCDVFTHFERRAVERADPSVTLQDDRGVNAAVHLLHGRFEAQFADVEAARAAAREARAVGFVTDVREDAAGWIIAGRRGLPFPRDERDRYASRFHGIATRHGGGPSRFVEEQPETLATPAAETLREEPDEK